MCLRQAVLAACMAGLVTAASLPLAVGDGLKFQDEGGHNAPKCLTGASGPIVALYAPARNPQQDFREPRPAPALTVAVVLQDGLKHGLCGQPGTPGEFTDTTPADATLFSLRCLLVV